MRPGAEPNPLMRRVAGLVLLALAGAVLAGPARPQGVGHEIQLTTNRFIPAILEVHPGDSLRFVNGMGGPHNVEFAADSIPEPARKALAAAMPGDKIGPLSSPLLLGAGEAYGFRVPTLPPGRYPFYCLPHVAGNMRGVLIVLPQMPGAGASAFAR
jgi:plastocyanin